MDRAPTHLTGADTGFCQGGGGGQDYAIVLNTQSLSDHGVAVAEQTRALSFRCFLFCTSRLLLLHLWRPVEF